MPKIITANLLLVISTVILIGVIFGLSLFVYQFERDRIFKELLSRMDRETAILVGDVNNRISTLALAITATARHISQTTRDRLGGSPIGNLRNYLVNITRNLPNLRTIIVIDPSGVVTDDLRPGQPALGFAVHDSEYFRPYKIGTPSGVIINDPVISCVDGKWTWHMSIAARDEKGKLLAVVLSSVDVRYFGVSIDRPVTSRKLESLIIHQNGTILQATNQKKSTVPSKISDFSLINTAKKEGFVISESTTDPFGRPNLMATAMKVPHWPVFIVNLLNRKVIDDQLIRQKMFIIIFSGITCLIIFLAAFFKIIHNSQRTRAEEGLRSSQQMLQTFFDTVPIGVLVKDRSGRYLMVNARQAALYGKSPADLTGKTFAELEVGTESQKELVAEDDRQVLENGATIDSPEAPLLLPDGRTIWRRRIKVPLRDTTGAIIGIVGVTEDITNHKRGEEERLGLMTAVEQASDGVLITDADGSIQYANPAFENITGYAREEVLGKNPRFLKCGKQNRQFYGKLWATILQGEVWEGKLTNQKKDGSLYEEEMTIYPIRNSAGDIGSFIAIKRDISERSRAEKLLRANEKRFRGLIENSMLPQVVIQQLKPVFGNQAFAEQFGFASREEVLAMPDLKMTMLPQDVGALIPQYFESMEGKIVRPNYERVGVRTDGTQFPVEVFLEKVEWDDSPAMLVTFLDLTERDQAKANLVESELWNTAILNSTGDGIIVMDEQGQITKMNPAAGKIFGYSVEETAGKMLTELFIPDQYRNKHNVGYQKILANAPNQVVDLQFEVVGLRKDGSEVQLEIVANQITSGDNLHLCLFIRDITERKKSEELIKIQQEQLIQADKMAMLGTLVSGVAHEINNPNAIITLNAPLLMAFWEDVLPILDAHQASNGEITLASIPYDRVRKDLPAMLKDIQSGADRIKTIVENLKDFARQGASGERSTISLNKVVESAMVLIGAKIRKATQNFRLELAEELPMVKANFQELEQIVINLITNSCDALEGPEKSITIATVFDPESQQAKILVTDEGEGIAQENMSRIKDPFFTTKRESGGTGLGLSVSQGIIQNHNGSLEFSSTPEGGVIATIALPVLIK